MAVTTMRGARGSAAAAAGAPRRAGRAGCCARACARPARGPAAARGRSRAPQRASASAAVAPPAVSQEVVEKSINAIRFLAIDGVEKANSGHPGLPMGCAPMTYVMWNEAMKHSPSNPTWFDRDRFVLSAGHGSMLHYAMLHLTGYESVPVEELKQFRQWGSKTPGHPENFVTKGIEVTTGPLGQGIANAVGLALAEKHLAARFNKPDCEVVDHYTYCIMGDGCNMEGISNEACSLAGHWGLGKLIAFYDDNSISIDGHTDISFTEDVSARYEALGWHTIHVEDGNTDLDAIRAAIEEAKSVTDKPTLIKVTTLIGYGSPNKANSHAVHGAALGGDEVEATRKNLGWDLPPFEVPSEVYDNMNSCISRGKESEAAWNDRWAAYQSKYPEEAAELATIMSREFEAGWESALPSYTPEDKGIATRLHSQTMLNALAPVIPGLIGGSADLAPSNMTLMKMFGDFQKDSAEERNVRFGVREQAMGAIGNGIGLHSPGFVPYTATFFIFTDYMRSSMRMAALSEVPHIFVMTHDSIGLGEDGPTHQPIEHLASFRAMPNMLMFRPADGNETAGAYMAAIQQSGTPSTLALSRQGMPNLAASSKEKVLLGAYPVHGAEGTPDVIIMATGSEVQYAVEAAERLEGSGKKVRVVSMPCWELFEEQSAEYKESVLPAGVTARVSVEAGSTFGWGKYVGDAGKSIGVDTFGASAPGPTLYEKFGITTDAVVAAAEEVMA